MVPRDQRQGAEDTEIVTPRLRADSLLSARAEQHVRHHQADNAGPRTVPKVRGSRLTQLPIRHSVRLLGAVPESATESVSGCGLRAGYRLLDRQRGAV